MVSPHTSYSWRGESDIANYLGGDYQGAINDKGHIPTLYERFFMTIWSQDLRLIFHFKYSTFLTPSMFNVVFIVYNIDNMLHFSVFIACLLMCRPWELALRCSSYTINYIPVNMLADRKKQLADIPVKELTTDTVTITDETPVEACTIRM